MKKGRIFGIALWIVIVIWSCFINLKNPDMTNTRLLMTYWKEYILCFIGAIVALYNVKK